MKIVVVDAQGGGVGKQLVAGIKLALPSADITAVGTNSIAASAMLKAGADRAASGENPVIVACRTADVIVGPAAIVIADALLGEITPKMAQTIGQSKAKRILIPFNHCENVIVGISDKGLGRLIQEAVEEIKKLQK
ncbi:MAG: DUF3842 family protein [Synergistaceae bacterium]|nr:DUF3842 family protein [Synergistaceae bacterium]